jgi:4-amino-4-deoxy-L-arabinose transferase-like glycosyltransferase
MSLQTGGRSGTWSGWLGLLLVVVFFCGPLFIGLRSWDIRNDEAIYDYAVDRILETGEWLTPHSSPHDDPFLEKPPLKFWIVAGAVKSGLLPWDEFGLRAIDALFCAIAFVYVFQLGRRFSGVAGGVIGVFLLYSFDPLLFEHGVRENNMESVLMLAYCGGMYHFLRWVETDTSGRRRAHALACAAFFSLGFMTKFVAALSLPFVWVLALAVRPGGARRLRDLWKDWIGPVALAAVAIFPWFIYETRVFGKFFWNIIVGVHVLTRFTASVDPSHVQPWNHYFLQTWAELGYADMLTIWVAGLVLLVYRAWVRGEWFARFLFLWWFAPLALMSLGTSKLYYYAYPFLPPLAIAGGGAGALLLNVLGEQARNLAIRLGLRRLAPEEQAARRKRPIGVLLSVLGLLAVIMALWTFIGGPVTLEVGGWRLFRNSSVVRPLVLAAILWYYGGIGAISFRIAAIAVLTLFLPLSRYPYKLERFRTVDHPLHAIRDCALSVQASNTNVGKGVLDVSAPLHHAYYYYLRRTGPWLGIHGWIHVGTPRPDELNRRLEAPGEEQLVILSPEDYRALGGNIPGDTKPGAHPEVSSPGPALAAPLKLGLPPGIIISHAVVILFPGPYGVCASTIGNGGSYIELKARPPALLHDSER